MVFELRPDLDWDKGTALRWLLGELAPGRPRPLPVYIGDDLTDEDAFREVHDGVGIIVRGADHPTLARYALDDPDHVHRFLERLAGVPGE
jgi:trehalose-phosphatase